MAAIKVRKATCWVSISAMMMLGQLVLRTVLEGIYERKMDEEICSDSSPVWITALHYISCNVCNHPAWPCLVYPPPIALQYSSIPLRKQSILENADSEEFSGVLWEAACLPYNNMLSSHMYSHWGWGRKLQLHPTLLAIMLGKHFWDLHPP